MDTVIDIEALLAPLSEDNPCGEDARNDTSFDSAYHALKDARSAAIAVERPDTSAQPNEGQSSAVTDISKWKNVVSTAIDILQNSSKDLEVCALLIEGLARTEGAAGIRDGFRLAGGLIENYWESLFPRLDPNEEDSLEDRIAAFTGLNGIGQPGTLATYIAKLPVTNDGGMEHFRSYDYDRAWSISNNMDLEVRGEQEAALGFSLEDIRKAASQTPAEFYITFSEQLHQCKEELEGLDQAFMNACGHESPPSSMIAESLEKLLDVVSDLGRDKLAQHAASLAAETDEADKDSAPSLQPGGVNKPAAPSGAIASRQDAIARLRVIADYFREAEPHSPLSYSLQNIIRWSQLPLDKLLEEWIQDPDARSRYMLMTGIRSAQSNDEGDYE